MRSGRLDCTVAEVRVVAAGTVSRVVCEAGGRADLGGSVHPEGVYLVDDRGLWALSVGDARQALGDVDVSAREPYELVFPLPLAASETTLPIEGRSPNDGEDGAWAHRRAITREGNAWCSTRRNLGGEEEETALCLRPVMGPIRGRTTVFSGRTPQVSFRRSR